MKRLAWTVIYVSSFLLGIMWAHCAEAAPFLLTDITDTAQVSTCSAKLDAVAVIGQIVTAAGACAIDLGGIANGNHTITVIYSNVWGETSSSPFTFVKSLPGTPSNARIMKELPR